MVSFAAGQGLLLPAPLTALGSPCLKYTGLPNVLFDGPGASSWDPLEMAEQS